MKSLLKSLVILTVLMPAIVLAQPVLVTTVYEPAGPTEPGISAESIALDAPAGVQLGDLIVGQVVVKGDKTITPAQTWEIAAPFPLAEVNPANGPGSVLIVLRRFADQSDVDASVAGTPDYYSFSWVGAAEATAFISIVNNVDQFQAFYGDVASSTEAATAFDSPDQSVPRDNALVLRFYAAHEDRTTTSDPTRVFETYTSANDSVAQGLATSGVQATAGPTGTYTWTVDEAGPSAGATQWVNTTIFVFPPATATYNVSKNFVPDDAAVVPVQFACVGGSAGYTVSASTGVVSEATPASFTVTGFNDADAPTCTVTETVPDTYSVGYSAGCSVAAGADDTNDCVITNTINSATFRISKTFTDGSLAEVNVQLDCTTGTEDAPEDTIGQAASLTVTGFETGNADCVVTETLPAGYAVSYGTDCAASVTTGSVYDCDISNATTVARFQVTKDFSDGSTDNVDVTLTCDTGLPLEQPKTIAGGDTFGVIFVVTDYIDGTMSCSVTEATNTPGYDADASGCVWDNVMTSDSPFSCVINNTAQDATFTAWMEWIIPNEGGNTVDPEVEVTIECTSEITSTSGTSGTCGTGCWEAWDDLGHGDSLTVDVSTLLADASCTASQASLPSGVELGGDCGGTHTIPAGRIDSCKFTNTVFFEGIPTLSQYGLALMALLMLGMGMVGFRRFA